MSDLSYNLILVSEIIICAGLVISTLAITLKIRKMDKEEKFDII